MPFCKHNVMWHAKCDYKWHNRILRDGALMIGWHTFCTSPLRPQLLRQAFHYRIIWCKRHHAFMSVWVCIVYLCCEGMQIIITLVWKLQKNSRNHTGQLVTTNLNNRLLILRVLSTPCSLRLKSQPSFKWFSLLCLYVFTVSCSFWGLDLGC